MKRYYRYYFLLLFMSATMMCCLHNAYAMATSQHYSFSMAAARQAIVQWLEQKGHSYLIIPEPGGLVRIQTSNHSEQWLIKLSPHSPLATTVSVQLNGSEQRDESIKNLMQYLDTRSRAKPLSEEQQQPEIPAAVLEKIGTVACIKANRKGQTVQFSGVFIDHQGLILCTAHNLIEHEEVSVVSTINTLFKGDIIKIDFKRDLALIRIETEKNQVVDLHEGRNLLGMGEKVFSIGCPVALRGTITAGFINGPPRMVDSIPIWQTSMEIQPGSSGSPVFDSNGTFVAMIKGRHRVSTGIGFLIPLEVIIDFISEQL